MKHPFNQFLGLLLLLVLAACNLPATEATPALSPIEQAGTTIAMTLRAGGLSTSVAAATTTSASPAAATPTTKPTLVIHVNAAKCRGGPGPDFTEIATYAAGTSVDMIAKDTADGYWLVKDPASGSSCWVQVQDATPGGSFDLLPEITPQASTQGVPASPTIFYANYFCDTTGLTTELVWNDVADNENGYRVYREGVKIADVAANSTTFSEKISFTLGSQVTYAVEAYNEAGASPQRTKSFHCP
jgi:hypothetical protein